jgi:hypothetical protein
VLVAARLLKPLGNPPPNNVKFFATSELADQPKRRQARNQEAHTNTFTPSEIIRTISVTSSNPCFVDPGLTRT